MDFSNLNLFINKNGIAPRERRREWDEEREAKSEGKKGGERKTRPKSTGLIGFEQRKFSIAITAAVFKHILFISFDG